LCFNCIAFAHIPKEKRSNLDAKNKVYIFVGYSEQSKAYQLLDVSTNKIVINRDVVVDEKIPFFSDNGKSMDSSVWETVIDSGTSSSVEIKQGLELET
jgi:hypothetical protein